MKSFWKILALCFVCGVTATMFVACGFNAEASENETTQEQTSDEISGDPTDETIGQHQSAETTIGGDRQPEKETSKGNNPPAETENPEPDKDNDKDELPTHEHHYDRLNVVITPATCTNPGLMGNVCSYPGCEEYIEAREILQIDHKLTGTTTIEATCTNPGEITYTCDYGCGYTETDKTTLKALGHNYQKTDIVVKPTCTEKGYTIYKCNRTNCDSTKHDDETNNIDPTNHDYDPATHICKRCHAEENPKTLRESLVEKLKENLYWITEHDGTEIVFNFKNYDKTEDMVNDGEYSAYFTKEEDGSKQILFNGTYKIESKTTDDGKIIYNLNCECKYQNRILTDRFIFIYEEKVNDNGETVCTLTTDKLFVYSGTHVLTFIGENI